MPMGNDCGQGGGREPGRVGRSVGPLFDADKSGPLSNEELARIRLATMPYLLEVGVRSDMALLITRLIETIDLERARFISDVERRRPFKEALFLAAPAFQGGHSDTGTLIAECLRVPFPITMPELERKVKEDGYDPHTLWPWLYRLRQGADYGRT